jgi:hypothetical protein
VRKTIADSRFPFSDRIWTLRAALAKFEPEGAPLRTADAEHCGHSANP